MQNTYIWNQFNLYRNKIILLAVFLFSGLQSFAQYTAETNLPYYDDKFIHYGFTLGIGSSRFKVKHSELYMQDSAMHARAPYTAMATIGLIANFRIEGFWDLRVLPTVAFYQRKVDYEFAGGHNSSQVTESTFIEVPILLKYKSQRRKNARMFMVAGVKPGIEAGAKKREKKETDLRTQNIDLAIDYGFGFDIYYQFFKFSPELRFSHGLANLLVNDPNPYAQSLRRITSHSVTLYLHFN
ncbi:MAG: porin family protein [Cytophagaceae bacterium]